MNYWRLSAADCDSDYKYTFIKYTFINGGGEHPYSMPGIRCSDCKATWGGSQTLPVECPQNLRDDALLHESGPIASDKFFALKARVSECLEASNSDYSLLGPGASFQPLHMKLASLPAVDFLWPDGPVVSELVKAKFVEAGVTGVTFCPVVIDKIGKYAPTDPVPMPDSGEPEDILEEAVAGSVASLPRLYEMVVTSESKIPKAFVRRQCKSCGRVEINDDKRKFVVYEKCTPGTDIFYLGSTLRIIINDKVRQLLHDSRFTNISVSEIPIEHQNP